MADDPLSSSPAFDLTISSFSEALRVVSVWGREQLSKPYAFDVVALASAHVQLGDDTILGSSAVLRIEVPNGVTRVVVGTVAAVEANSSTVHHGARAYTIRIRPRLWQLKKRVTSRIFQNKSVPDIVAAVLGGSQGSLQSAVHIQNRFQLSKRYEALEYVVQYDESDLDFVRRLLAEAGILFYFESPHGEDAAVVSAGGASETVVFIDDAGSYPPMAAAEASVAGIDVNILGAMSNLSRPAAPRLVLRSLETEKTKDDVVDSFSMRVAVESNGILLKDYDFQRPLLDLKAQKKSNGSTSSTAPNLGGLLQPRSASDSEDGPELVRYEHRGDFLVPQVDEARAEMVLEEYRRRAAVAQGASACRRVSPGFRFVLDAPEFPSLAGEYVVIEVDHEGQVPELTTNTAHPEHQQVYRNGFHAVRASVTYRPKRPKRRFTQVLESAKVVGPKNEEIHTDEHGRVRVKFPWDLDGREDGTDSCWIRVSQTWAGPAWGSQFVPRVGMEVLVGFLTADPDCPVVLGCAYNKTQPPSYKLPEHKTRSGWKTSSTPATGGYNEIMFEDAAGRELLRIQAEKDKHEIVKHDRSASVGLNDSTTAGISHTVVITPPDGSPSASTHFTDKKLVFDTGAGARITMENDKIRLEAKTIEIIARDVIDLEGKKKGINTSTPSGSTNMFGKKVAIGGVEVSIDAKQLKLAGSASADLTSGGPANIAGTPVQLNGPGPFCGRVTESAPDTIMTGAALVLVGGPPFPLSVTQDPDGTIHVGSHIAIKPEGNPPRYPGFQSLVLRDLAVMSSSPAGRERLMNIQNNPGGHDVTIHEYDGKAGDDGFTFNTDHSKGAPCKTADGEMSHGEGSNYDLGYNPEAQEGPPGGPNLPSDAMLSDSLGHADHSVNGVDRSGENLQNDPDPNVAGFGTEEDRQTMATGINNPDGTGTRVSDPDGTHPNYQSPSTNDYLAQRGYPYRIGGQGLTTPDGTPV